MALALTMFLHRGFSEVSVSFFCSSASSSGLSLGAFFCSRPQKHITAFLQKPGSSSGSAMEDTRAMRKLCWCLCVNVNVSICVFTVSLLITFYFHRTVIVDPVILFKVHPLFLIIPQAPAQSIELDKQHNTC